MNRHVVLNARSDHSADHAAKPSASCLDESELTNIVPSPKISRNGTLINDVIPLSAKPTIF